jgi:VanZ family protein
MPHSEHFEIFATTGSAFGMAYGRRYGAAAIGLVIFAGSVEIAQLFSPRRHARVTDCVIDVLALLSGLTVAMLPSQLNLARDTSSN